MRFRKVDKHLTFNIYDPIGIRLLTLTRLWTEIPKKFWYSLGSICHCGYEIESTEHILSYNPYFLLLKESLLLKTS